MSRVIYNINALPKTLERVIKLNRVTGLEIITSYKANMYSESHEFLKNILPSLKYYNEGFYYKKIIKETQKTPMYRLYHKGDKILYEFQPEKMVYEEILEKILEHDQV